MQIVLANLLLEYQPLAALVGRNIDWNVSPQGTTGPRIVMLLVSQPQEYTMAGPDDLVESRVQFDCRAQTAAQARELAQRLDERLSGYRGTFQGFKFRGAFKQSQRTRFDDDGTTKVHTASVDYLIWSAPA